MELNRIIGTWGLLLLYLYGLAGIINPAIVGLVRIPVFLLSPVVAFFVAKHVEYDTRKATWSGFVLLVIGITTWTVLRGGTLASFAPEPFEFVVSAAVRTLLAVVAVYCSYRIGSWYAEYRVS